MSSPDHLTRLLAVERAAAPPSGTAEAELQRLLGSMAAHVAPLPVGVGSLKLGWLVIAKWVGVGFAVGLAGAGAASFVANAGPNTHARAASVASTSVTKAAATPVAPSEVEAHPVAASAAPVAPPVDGARRAYSVNSGVSTTPSPLPSAAPVAAPGLEEELRLITAAKRELDQGHGHLARVWLDEHRARFPGGVFALEREGLVVLAACSGAPNPSLASDFAKRHPESPMLAQVRRRCAAEGSSQPAAPARADFIEGDK